MTKKGFTQKKTKLIYGWGVNDSSSPVFETEVINGKQTITYRCPYYDKWTGMLERCFSLTYKKKKPSYEACTVTEVWMNFTSFKKWVDLQPNRNWQVCQLDKDLLKLDNKLYSEDSCVFIDNVTNSFITDRKRGRGDYLLGVSFHEKSNKLVAQCNDPLKKNGRHIGYYTDELVAHKAWQAKKHEYACQLADLQEDSRVADALRQRYAPDKDWTAA